MDMTQHSLPHILRIVGAIDACHIHAGFQETADQFVVCVAASGGMVTMILVYDASRGGCRKSDWNCGPEYMCMQS